MIDRIKVSNAQVEPLGMDEQKVAEDLNRHVSLTLGRDEGNF